MSDDLDRFEDLAETLSTAPSLAEMPRRSLADKGIAGPTAAHVIEEVHTPFNLAYLTFTTGSSAFQNIVGVVHSEIDGRCEVARRLFQALGIDAGRRMLVTYAPLVNVFSKEALVRCGIDWSFLSRSSRDAFLAKFCREKPDILLGESSFIRASLAAAKQLGLGDDLPKSCVILTAGTPLDLELLPEAEALGYTVHDLYGCQEFGWLTLDGVPLRDDISLVASPADDGFRELVVGGLPMGDSFPVSASGHVCNPAGKIITYRRHRTHPEYEVVVLATTLAAAESVNKVARTILRIKGRVVKVSPDLITGALATELTLVPSLVTGSLDMAENGPHFVGPVATKMFDDLLAAQVDLQTTAKTDPVWTKRR
ncbi:MAG: acyl carrier protein [Rhodospirillaceae bacterium]|nr:acyl carrier protein [Rhodospirillaceae bacterium]